MIYMLKKAGSDLQAKANDGKTFLMYAATTRNVNLVNYLLNHGAPIDAQDNEGWTALMRAVDVDNKEIVIALLQRGAKVSCRSKADETAVMIAKRRAGSGVIEAIENHKDR